MTSPDPDHDRAPTEHCGVEVRHLLLAALLSVSVGALAFQIASN